MKKQIIAAVPALVSLLLASCHSVEIHPEVERIVTVKRPAPKPRPVATAPDVPENYKAIHPPD